MSDDVIRAAGGVLFRRASGTLETLLVHRPRYDDLTIPKGKALDGESIEETARREIREETGLSVGLGPELVSTRYHGPDGLPKEVRYWLARPEGEGTFRPSNEVDALRWVRVTDAPAALSYDRDRDVLAAATGLTEPLYLVRHAKAGSRSRWRGDDRLRPLSSKGVRQAEGLVAAFDGRAITRILSSATDRCVQTVEPLARDRGLRVETVPWLFEGPDGPATLRSIRALAGPAVLCTHGDVIPEVVQTLEDEGVPLEGPVAWKKGSTWVLERDLGFPSRLRYEASPRDRAG